MFWRRTMNGMKKIDFGKKICLYLSIFSGLAGLSAKIDFFEKNNVLIFIYFLLKVFAELTSSTAIMFFVQKCVNNVCNVVFVRNFWIMKEFLQKLFFLFTVSLFYFS